MKCLEAQNQKLTLYRRRLYRARQRARELLPGSRVHYCHEWVDSHRSKPYILPEGVSLGKDDVPVLTTSDGWFYFGNLYHCGCGHECPVCRDRILRQRCKQTLDVCQRWSEDGGKLYVMNFTVPHHKNNSLFHLKSRFDSARKLMRKRPSWKTFASSIGLVHTITQWEYTYSDANGWHYHVHEIGLCRNDVTLDCWECGDKLLELWSKACTDETVGLPKPNRRGVDFCEAYNLEHLAGYLVKWGLASELTLSDQKLSGQGGDHKGLTPMAILELSDVRGADPRWARLFQEYVRVASGSCLQKWSPGLRSWLEDYQLQVDLYIEKELGLAPGSSDAETARADLDRGGVVDVIPSSVWLEIRRTRSQLKILEIAECEGWAVAKLWLRDLLKNCNGTARELQDRWFDSS